MINLSVEEQDALRRALESSTALISKGRLIGDTNNMFTAYVLTDESREKLMKKFPPKFEKVFAHHVTQDFGVGPDTPIPAEANIRAIGYATNGDDIEAIVVTVDGEKMREDGKFYHITWSLNPETKKPVDSANIIGYGTYQLILPIELSTTPELLN